MQFFLTSNGQCSVYRLVSTRQTHHPSDRSLFRIVQWRFSPRCSRPGCKPKFRKMVDVDQTEGSLLPWLKSHDWNYHSLIYCERKTLFIRWNSTTHKLSEHGLCVCYRISAVLLPEESADGGSQTGFCKSLWFRWLGGSDVGDGSQRIPNAVARLDALAATVIALGCAG